MNISIYSCLCRHRRRRVFKISTSFSPTTIIAISVRSTITIIPIVVFTRQSIVINRSASREPASVARATSNSTPAWH